jgi:hypothetical protein
MCEEEEEEIILGEKTGIVFGEILVRQKKKIIEKLVIVELFGGMIRINRFKNQNGDDLECYTNVGTSWE